MTTQQSDLHQRFLYLLDRMKAMQMQPVAGGGQAASNHSTRPAHVAHQTAENDIADVRVPDAFTQAERSDQRMRCLKKGKIVYAGGDFEVSCQIRDLTTKGAKLKLDGEVAVPLRFDLHIPADQIKLTAEKRWQNDNEIGVEFV